MADAVTFALSGFRPPKEFEIVVSLAAVAALLDGLASV
jgi:hypothetical protein